MPMKVLAKVDVAEEMQGGTLKFPTGKKRLEDEKGGIFCYRLCPELRLCQAILVLMWRSLCYAWNFFEVERTLVLNIYRQRCIFYTF